MCVRVKTTGHRPQRSLACYIEFSKLWAAFRRELSTATAVLRRDREGQLLQKKKRLLPGKLASSVQRSAREQAEQEARRVPWQLLMEARNQYLDWQEFYCWARSIMESEDSIPNWLAKKLDELCPGFLVDEKQYLARHPNEASLTPVRLGHWIDEHIFSFAQQGGWLLIFCTSTQSAMNGQTVIPLRLFGKVECARQHRPASALTNSPSLFTVS
jgi:hypothetical protein